MTQVRPSLSPVEPELDSLAGVDQTALSDTPRWPVTTLTALGLTLLVFVCLLAPETIAGISAARWLALLLPAMLATASARVLFEASDPGAPGRGLRDHVIPALLAAAFASGLLTAAGAIVGVHFSLVAPIAAGGLTTGALVAAGCARDIEVRVRLALRRVFFVGASEARQDLEREVRRHSDASFVGAATTGTPIDAGRLTNAVRESRATVLVLDRDAMRDAALVDVASQLNLAGLHVRDLVSYYESEFKKVPLGELSPTWFLFDIAPIHRRPLYRLMRRSLEVIFAATLLILSLPLLVASIAAIKLTTRGPALFRQERVGKNGARFTLVKLRTMVPASGSIAAWAGADANRITPVGRVLRRFRLDELPQLWSVIRGDLALIGPRPEQVAIAERLDRELPHYNARHCVRPGITGWAQVNLGYAGSVEGTIAKLQRDLYYIKHSSLRLDGLILWLTFKTVIAGRG
jgi:lipopolysaccharide/colanic/teichoic acid biosynthesis glycosyltransferase